jgi:hypothetical protein
MTFCPYRSFIAMLQQAAETFTFLCPICHQPSDHVRSRLRTRSHCSHCHAPVVLLDFQAHDSNRHPPEAHEPARTNRRYRTIIAQTEDVVGEVFWSILVSFVTVLLTPVIWLLTLVKVLLTPVIWLLNRAKSKYRHEGWKGLTQFRLSHFLIAVTLLALAMAFYGPRYAQEWKLRKEAREFYASKLAIADERESVQRTVTRLGGYVFWNSAESPPGYYMALRGHDWQVLRTKASISHYGRQSRAFPISPPDWHTALSEYCRYPELIKLSLHEPKIEGLAFEKLPASESLQELEISDDSFPLEGFQWCAKCPNLRSLSVQVGQPWQPKENAADDVWLRAVTQSPSLEVLSIKNADFSAEGLATLGELDSLRELNLSMHRPLNRDEMAQLAELPLERLSIQDAWLSRHHAPLSDEVVTVLCEKAAMRKLDFGPGVLKELHFKQLKAALPGKEINVVVPRFSPSIPKFAPP